MLKRYSIKTLDIFDGFQSQRIGHVARVGERRYRFAEHLPSNMGGVPSIDVTSFL